jgi:hypothetical protein
VSLRVEYHELVDADLEHARSWYEDHERGLGDRLIVMAVLQQHPLPEFGTERKPRGSDVAGSTQGTTKAALSGGLRTWWRGESSDCRPAVSFGRV